MHAGVRIVDERELARLVNELKLISGGKVIKRELVKEIKKLPNPLIADIRKASRQMLPKAGGLAKYIATSVYKTKVSIRANSVRADLVGWKPKSTGDGGGAARVDVKRIDAGRLRHPTYGHKPWVTQTVTPGYFTKPTEASEDDLRQALERVADSIIKRIT